METEVLKPCYDCARFELRAFDYEVRPSCGPILSALCAEVTRAETDQAIGVRSRESQTTGGANLGQ